MTCGSRNIAGFTLIEIIVAMAVIAIMASAMVPMATATIKAEKIDKVEAELRVLAEAAENYYYDNGAFPRGLNRTGFYGRYFVPGIADEAITDEWGTSIYRMSLSRNPDVLTIWSVGENLRNNGPANEIFKTVIQGNKPGNERTRLRMRIIAAAVAAHVGGGGTISGDWQRDHRTMRLGATYLRDGFGTRFRLTSGSLTLTSAGADRKFSTADDIVF